MAGYVMARRFHLAGRSVTDSDTLGSARMIVP